ncbi:MAG: UDP-N-acetylmuramoyl-L-alanyl-D-glutamate--2,6-diaminopimelate ligase [Cyanobacteria bacterium HKST-UBA02]|nr:UDP-N-acetylmuramoyl-L-alanyl-D-glutamate--2,6-diaminopimelate ligase [Cyanobacteria bacterium HKST-UBA02]
MKHSSSAANIRPKEIEPLLRRWGLQSGMQSRAQEFTGLAYDSRSLARGDIFFCIQGEKFDGNDYVRQAAEQGAALIISEKQKPNAFFHPYVQVPDIRLAMADAASYYYEEPSKKLRILAVTGTNGKTSTTHLIEHIFNGAGKKAGLVGTMGARWPRSDAGKAYVDMHHTTPQCIDLQSVLASMAEDRVTHVAMEVSSHALVLKRVELCHFASACLTNVTQDHLDFHKTMDNYWKSKRLLFTALTQSCHSNRSAIINIDDGYAREFINAVDPSTRVYTYGFSKDADYRVLDATYSQSGTRIILKTPSGSLNLNTPLVGHFNVYNVLAALVVCLGEGIPPSACLDGIETFTGVDGRFQVVSAGGGNKEPLCIVDYAHSPDGLENVLKVARGLVPANGRLIVVFGCGGDRDRSKRPQMGSIAEVHADRVFVTSDNPRSEDPKMIIADILAGITRIKDVVVEQDREKAIHAAIAEAGSNDVVVVAGKGHETYQLIKDEVLDFDDRIKVREALEARLK